VGTRFIELFQPGVKTTIVDLNESQRAEPGIEVAGIHRAAGIDQQHAANRLNRGDMRIAVDHDVPGTAKVVVHHRLDRAVGRPLGQGHIVCQAELEAFELQLPGFAETRIFRLNWPPACTVVSIAAGDIDRGDLLELVDQ